MRLGKFLSSLTKPELDYLKTNLSLTDDEEMIFDLVSKNKSLTEVSMKTGFSVTTIKRRKNDILQKVGRLNNG